MNSFEDDEEDEHYTNILALYWTPKQEKITKCNSCNNLFLCFVMKYFCSKLAVAIFEERENKIAVTYLFNCKSKLRRLVLAFMQGGEYHINLQDTERIIFQLKASLRPTRLIVAPKIVANRSLLDILVGEEQLVFTVLKASKVFEAALLLMLLSQYYCPTYSQSSDWNAE